MAKVFVPQASVLMQDLNIPSSINTNAFNSLRGRVIQQFEDYLDKEENKRFEEAKKIIKQGKEMEKCAVNVLESMEKPILSCGPTRYDPQLDFTGVRVFSKESVRSDFPNFVSSQPHVISTVGVRNPFKRTGLVTNPTYTRKTSEERMRDERIAKSSMDAKDISLPGTTNVPQTQQEMNMQTRADRAINTAKFIRAQNTQLGKPGEMRQSVLSGTNSIVYEKNPVRGRVNRDFDSQRVVEPRIRLDVATEKMVKKAPRGILQNTSAPKRFTYPAESRSVRRPLVYTKNVIEPRQVKTRKFVLPDPGYRSVIRREAFAREGQGALDVLDPTNEPVYRTIPGLAPVTRPRSMYADPGAVERGRVTYENVPILTTQKPITTRPMRNAERGGQITTTVKPERLATQNMNIHSRPSHARYQGVVPERGMFTIKDKPTYHMRPGQTRAVDNPFRF